jgi:hypothetical protein
LFSTKLFLGMVSVAEIRNVSVLLSNMLRVHKEQISDLSNNLSVACRYIFLLGNYSETILGEKAKSSSIWKCQTKYINNQY